MPIFDDWFGPGLPHSGPVGRARTIGHSARTVGMGRSCPVWFVLGYTSFSFGVAAYCAACGTRCISAFACRALPCGLAADNGNRGLFPRSFLLCHPLRSCWREHDTHLCRGVSCKHCSVSLAAVEVESLQCAVPLFRAVVPVGLAVFELLFPVTRSRLPSRFVSRR